MKISAKKIFKTLLNLILAFFGLILLYLVSVYLVVKIKNPNGVPMPFGYGASFVLSGSMEPNITVDDLVFIKKAEEISVGDVILYNTGKSNVLHRIIRINGNTIVTKGDANNTEDLPIKRENIIGVYVGKITGGGKVVKFITNPPFIMALVFLLIIIVFSWLLIAEKKDEKRLENLRKKVTSLRKENEELRKKL